jgi:23S rRNA pseudouridine1911/1915/1917 synthase
LAARFPALGSRSRLKRDLLSLHLNGRPARPSALLRAGDRVDVVLQHTPPFPGVVAEAIPLAIVYEDADLLVINKTFGMPVHPSAGHPSGTLVNALLAHCGPLPGETMRPGIVHRLDRDTSGLIVCAKREPIRLALSAAFAARGVEKGYETIVKGRPSPAAGIIDAPLGRDPHHRKRRAVVPGGKPARTGYRVIGGNAEYAHLAIDLFTGRTHQIRVHLAHLRHPIVGDPVYARPDHLADQLCLAAVRLAFSHPGTGERLEFRIPPPAHMLRALEKLLDRGTGRP